MAFLTRRRDGRFEIRESVTTPRGPRARTLAVFHTLRPSTLAHAASRAQRPFDPSPIERRADEWGIVRADDLESGLTKNFLRRLALGTHQPAPIDLALVERLRSRASDLDVPDTVPGALEWINRSPDERGQAIRELLGLATALQQVRSRRGLTFPRLGAVTSSG